MFDIEIPYDLKARKVALYHYFFIPLTVDTVE